MALQETHSSNENINIWNAQWKGVSILAHGETNARGVAILFGQDLDVKIMETGKGSNGRIVYAKVEIEQMQMVIINVYFPTADKEKEQLDLLKSIKDLAEKFNECHKVLLGDFNVVMNSMLDRKRHHNKGIDNESFRKELMNVMEDNSMIDIWRIRNPQKVEFSWHRNDIGSRLDYILIEESMENRIVSVGMESSPFSDHRMVKMAIDLRVPNKGRGYWKFNNSLLEDDNYCNLIGEWLREETEEPSKGNAKQRWELMKFQECWLFSLTSVLN